LVTKKDIEGRVTVKTFRMKTLSSS
jgi:hypothetical protein